VNGGSGTAVYLSAVTHDLDFDVKLGRLVQLEDKRLDGGELATRYPAEASQLAADGRRISLHLEDAIDEKARRLAELGHTRVAFLSAPRHLMADPGRLYHFRRTAGELGLRPQVMHSLLTMRLLEPCPPEDYIAAVELVERPSLQPPENLRPTVLTCFYEQQGGRGRQLGNVP